MLKRLEGEEARVQQLVSTGELSPEGGELTAKQVRKSREELLSELQVLGGKPKAGGGPGVEG